MPLFPLGSGWKSTFNAGTRHTLGSATPHVLHFLHRHVTRRHPTDSGRCSFGAVRISAFSSNVFAIITPDNHLATVTLPIRLEQAKQLRVPYDFACVGKCSSVFARRSRACVGVRLTRMLLCIVWRGDGWARSGRRTLEVRSKRVEAKVEMFRRKGCYV